MDSWSGDKLAMSAGDLMIQLVRHRAYVKGDARGLKADFSFNDLSNASLAGEQLKNVCFKGANLNKAKLSHCDLTGADFFGADMEGADLTGSILTGADFRGANLHRAILSNANLRSADFSASGSSAEVGRKTCLSEARMDHAILCQANLTGCDMSGSDLVEADLTGADLSLTVLLGADLSGAALTDARMQNTVLEISRLSAQQAKHVDAGCIVGPAYIELAAGVLQRMFREHGRWIATGGGKGKRLELDGVKISGIETDVKSLAGSRLRRCELTGVDFSEKILDMADLSYSNLRCANLQNASLRGTNLRSAMLAEANLKQARLDAMPLEAMRNWPTNLDKAILRDADLTHASFSNAIMTNADICGSVISFTNFSGVDLRKVRKNIDTSRLVDNSCRRTFQRYSEPKLYVKINGQTYQAANWSMGGICIVCKDDKRLSADQDISAKIMVKEFPPPLEVTLSVVKDDGENGLVMLKFVAISDAVKRYLSVLPIAKSH